MNAVNIKELGLKNRTYNRLYGAKIRSIGHLCEHTPQQLLRIREFGITSLEDVQQALAKHGLSLKSRKHVDLCKRRLSDKSKAHLVFPRPNITAGSVLATKLKNNNR